MQLWEEFEASYPQERWLLREPNWEPKRQKVRETQFTLGNGHLSSRGVLEEIPYDCTPGTFIAGLYDRTGAQVTELVNLPNPVYLRVDVYGEKLGMIAMDTIKHERALDMKHGILYRQTLFKTTHKKKILYQSRRFISMHDKRLGVMEVKITPLDAAMTFNLQTTVDATVSNKGVLTEGRKIHYMPCEIGMKDNLGYFCVKTFEHQRLIAYATAFDLCKKERCILTAERALSLRVKKNETITIRKYFVISTSKTDKPSLIKKQTIGALKKARRMGFDKLLDEHCAAWDRKWDNANIEIEGDTAAEHALRFNIYHLIIAGNEGEDDVSIGARTLSGEGYRGHVFWDSEIFDLPFFIYTFPGIARNQLMYRYNRLNPARANASVKKFKGAMFPWESAYSGEESTPSWAKDLDGTIIRITTLYFEHHIVADVAYAVDQYIKSTNDMRFLMKNGLEIIFETARFWDSRVEWNKKRKRYEILHITGPDEFHDDVPNNAFTNLMAQWNLQAASEWYKRAKQIHAGKLKELARRIKLTEKEVNSWQRTASKIHIPFNTKKRILEQFEGYLKLRDPRITELDHHFMPLLPRTVTWRTINKTQLIKQADVVMILYLLSDWFDKDEKKRNYAYYERRTLHKSSLSYIIHSIVGLEVGDDDRALHYFAHALATDITDVHGNTSEGMHAASAGGTWQAVVMGFAGMRVHKDYISFAPCIPPSWRSLKFSIWYHGAKLRVSINQKHSEIKLIHVPAEAKITATVNNIKKRLMPHKTTIFQTQNNWVSKKERRLKRRR